MTPVGTFVHKIIKQLNDIITLDFNGHPYLESTISFVSKRPKTLHIEVAKGNIHSIVRKPDGRVSSPTKFVAYCVATLLEGVAKAYGVEPADLVV